VVAEDVVVAHLLLFLLHLLLLLPLRLKSKLEVVELVQSIQLLVADRNAVGEDALAQGLD
jgi:hypothetical protein